MKQVNNLSQKMAAQPNEDKTIICHYVNTPIGIVALKNPIVASEKECEYCHGRSHFCTLVNPGDSDLRTWLCANPLCLVYSSISTIVPCLHTTQPKRALLWPSFCDLNDIGDIHYDVRFESINQNEGKISYMLKFAAAPRGILFMRGKSGTGKTYAAMGICEFFTRKSISAKFITQKRLVDKWLQCSRHGFFADELQQMRRSSLLVIDEFGNGDPSDEFLKFFFDVIDERLQWTNRGTVITTNLNLEKFNAFCGEALADRIMTGQEFIFMDESRRQKTIL